MHIVAQIFSIAVSEGRVFLPDVKWCVHAKLPCAAHLDQAIHRSGKVQVAAPGLLVPAANELHAR